MSAEFTVAAQTKGGKADDSRTAVVSTMYTTTSPGRDLQAQGHGFVFSHGSIEPLKVSESPAKMMLSARTPASSIFRNRSMYSTN